MNILHLDSSPAGNQSASRRLSRAIVDQLIACLGSARVIRRDLAALALPHLDSAHYDRVRNAWAKGGSVDASGTDGVDPVLTEFLAADIVVVGAPMHNFSVPTQLKCWIDRVMIPGRSFVFTEAGPVGLCQGKQAYIASSRGSTYVGAPYEMLFDHQEAYLRAVFAFMGMPGARTLRAEGLDAPGTDRQQALQKAIGVVDDVVTQRPALHAGQYRYLPAAVTPPAGEAT